jgi:hypothetical protein
LDNVCELSSKDEAMQICVTNPQCIGCPLVDKSMNINGATITCMNAQVFNQKGDKK